jgi:hypothetical protein
MGGSAAAKFWAAYRVLRGSANEEAAAALVEQINPFASCAFRVEYWRVLKRGAGGFRVLCSLPRPLKAANYMVKDVLECVYEPGPHLYAVRGRGKDREARAIKRVLDSAYEYAFVADVRSCFDSVRPDALYGLPLPQTVIHCVLDHRSMAFRRNSRKEEDAAGAPATQVRISGMSPRPRNGPAGLVPGSPSSSLILAWLFDELTGSMRVDCHLFVFADNILVLTRSERDSRVAQWTLRNLLRQHRAGPFRLAGEGISAALGFERLGYEYRKTIFGYEINLSASNIDCLFAEVEAAKQQDLRAGRTAPVEAERVLGRSLSGFSGMTGRAAFIDGLLDATRLELRRELTRQFGQVSTSNVRQVRRLRRP